MISCRFNTSNSSNWSLVARQGECAILVNRGGDVVDEAFQVQLPSLSGCPAVSMTRLNTKNENGNSIGFQSSPSFVVGSIHVKASVSNRDAWYSNAIDILEQSIPQDENIIVGGDFNHNLTSIDEPWQLVYGTDLLLNGTAQKEFNWMGTFDGFFVSTNLVVEPLNYNVLVTTVGFMPKVVQGLPQQGVVQTDAQFATNQAFTETLFSPTSNGSNMMVVPFSNPRNQVLSDHLLVTATFGEETTVMPPVAPTTTVSSLVPSSTSFAPSTKHAYFFSIFCSIFHTPKTLGSTFQHLPSTLHHLVTYEYKPNELTKRHVLS